VLTDVLSHLLIDAADWLLVLLSFSVSDVLALSHRITSALQVHRNRMLFCRTRLRMLGRRRLPVGQRNEVAYRKWTLGRRVAK